MFGLPFFRNASSAHACAPKLLISITTSSPILSLSNHGGTTGPFSITLEAFVTGTDDNQPITIYAVDTLLHPETGSEALEYQGLVFTDTATRKAAGRFVVNACYHYPESLSDVSPSNAKAFVEIPSKDGPGAGKPYTITYYFDNGKSVNLMDPEQGFRPDRDYEISLGARMSCVSWWTIGKKDHILKMGQRDGTRVDFMPSESRLQMVLDSETTFRVTG